MRILLIWEISHISFSFLFSIFSSLYPCRSLPTSPSPTAQALLALVANALASATTVAPELQAEVPTAAATCSNSSPNA